MALKDVGDRLGVDPNLQIVRMGADHLLCRTSRGTFELVGEEAARLLAALHPTSRSDDHESIDELLPGPEGASNEVLVDRGGAVGVSTMDIPQIVVVGNGRLATSIASRLNTVLGLSCDLVVIRSMESCLDPEFLSRAQADIILETNSDVSFSEADAAQAVAVLDNASEDDLGPFVSGAFLICAFEGTRYKAFFTINDLCLRLGTPVLFVTPNSSGTSIGPLLVPQVTPCFECFQRSSLPKASIDVIEAIDLLKTGSASESEAHAIADLVVRLVTPLPQDFKYALHHSLVVRNGRQAIRPLAKIPDCHKCSSQVATQCAWPELTSAALVAHRGFTSVYHRENRALWSEYNSICIVGGGTAGYLAALAFQRALPNIEIVLVESKDISIIGVGEATTPELVLFLHKYLGFNIAEFFEEVRPSWKLGIRFDWGLSGEYYFNYPFGENGQPLESYVYDGDVRNYCLMSKLMSSDKMPVFKVGDSIKSFLHDRRFIFAYHLDNKRFVRYIKEKAVQRGIRQINATIDDVVLSENGESVDSLIATDGRRLKYDMYVDCTGFRSMILGKALGSHFTSWEGSLPTDTAIVASVPHDDHIKPYTVAETMDYGWCWNIPLPEEDHRGYVFASSFCSVEDAQREMIAKNSKMSDNRIVKFRTGRHEEFWKGNVVALGNSYGFVEPLQSTAIHMIVEGIRTFISHFPSSTTHGYGRAQANKVIADAWDELRWFLSIHYKFNNRSDSSFWDECRNTVDISGVEDTLGSFREGAPLTYRTHSLQFDNRWGDLGRDVILLGQKVAADLLEPRVSRSDWKEHVTRMDQTVQIALSQREALNVFEQRPDMLNDLVYEANSWLRDETFSPAADGSHVID